MLYGMMVNGSNVYYKTNSTTFLTTEPVLNSVTPSPVNSIKMTNLTIPPINMPFRGNHSLQIKYDGTNISYYVDGQIIVTPGQSHTFTPVTKAPYYLVMSFANGDQFSSIPLGRVVPPTNFTLQVISSELFGATGLLGTAQTHLQMFNTAEIQNGANAVWTAAPTAPNTPSILFTRDNVNSSAAAVAEITHNSGIFTYTAIDGSSRAMVNLTVNITSIASTAGAFSYRCAVFTGQPSTTAKMVFPLGGWAQSMGSVTPWTSNAKFSFIMNSGDSFLLQAYGGSTQTTGTWRGSIIVEKFPVAQGGGGRRVPVSPIRKLPKRISLKVRKSSRIYTKKGAKKNA
jgi:hypothetical protein